MTKATARTLSPLFTWRGAVASPESGLSPTTRHVALTLSLHMSEKGDSAYPGAVLLAAETGLAESTVREHLKMLTDGGWLVLVERGGLRGERRRANAYQAAVPLREDEGSGDAPLRLPVGTPPANGADPSGSRTPGRQESVIEDARARDPFIEEFERAWALYPRKTNRKGALKAYQARRREGIGADELQRATENYAAERKGEDPSYTLHGATFYGPNERWRDHLKAKARTGAQAPWWEPDAPAPGHIDWNQDGDQ